jgi:hypothetical protein
MGGPGLQCSRPLWCNSKMPPNNALLTDAFSSHAAPAARQNADVRPHAMRHALIALAAATLILGAMSGIFLIFEPAVSPGVAFWPGSFVQAALERVGVLTTNRILPWATLLFWWLVIWFALSLAPRRRPRAA